MKRFLLFTAIVFVLGWTQTFAQKIETNEDLNNQMHAFSVGNNIIRSQETNLDYILILNELLSHPEFFKYPSYYDMVAWFYTYLGHDQQGIEIGDKAFPKPKSKTGFNPDDYEIIDAVDYIVQKATDHQAIMINEEHRMPRHRQLTRMLLDPLFEIGYKYLLVETLTLDSTLQRNGTPVLASGYYSKDPVFGEMLRLAHQIGYIIVPYEMTPAPKDFGMMDPLKRQYIREEIQAKNIIDRVLSHDPHARILVHVGRGHNAEVYEEQEGGGVFAMMGGIFKLLSGIDPLTIDQLEHSEHTSELYESSVAAWLRRRPDVGHHEAGLLRDLNSGNILTKDGYDLTVINQRATYQNSRPDWLIRDPLRNELKISVQNYNPPDGKYFLVQAVCHSEDHIKSIPADQYAYSDSEHTVLMLLRKGKYLLRIIDDQGLILTEWIEEII